MTTQSRRALVVRGGWDGHVPVPATDRIIPFLEQQGFVVQVADSPAPYADATTMAATDLVVQCVSMGAITDEEVAGLTAAVAAGTGLVGWHGGIVDAYRASAEYLQLVGGQFVAHPTGPPDSADGGATADSGATTDGVATTDGAGTAPEPAVTHVRHTIAMTELGRTHPVTAGLDDFALVTEQYWVLTDDLDDVLATTTHPVRPGSPWHRPITVPAVWTRQWGDGRIVVCTPGHAVDVLDHPSVRAVIERGITWAART